MMPEFKFTKEAALCDFFIQALPDGWTAYPETCDFDIVLAHNETGTQIGVEAKLRLNAKVLLQALPDISYPRDEGPDFRAVLVPHGKRNEIAAVAKYLGITVICADGSAKRHMFWPELPKIVELSEHGKWSSYNDDWEDYFPVKRLALPDFIPDTASGTPSPIKLTEWKIKAIKLIILLDRFGNVSRQDFNALRLNMGRWTQGRWLEPTNIRGVWKRGEGTPDLAAEHPKNFEEIREQTDDWLPDHRRDELGQLGVAAGSSVNGAPKNE